MEENREVKIVNTQTLKERRTENERDRYCEIDERELEPGPARTYIIAYLNQLHY